MLRSLLCSIAALAAFAGLTFGVAQAAPTLLSVDTVACGQARDALIDAQKTLTALPVDASEATKAAAAQAVANAQARVNAECVTTPPTSTTVPPTSTVPPPTSTTPPPTSTVTVPPSSSSIPPSTVIRRVPVLVACNDLRTRQDTDREAVRRAILRINGLHDSYRTVTTLTPEQARVIRDAYSTYDVQASQWRRLIGDRRLACRDTGGDTRLDTVISPAPPCVRTVVSTCPSCTANTPAPSGSGGTYVAPSPSTGGTYVAPPSTGGTYSAPRGAAETGGI